MKEKVIAVFDIGKTNKKVILFDYNLKLVSETEQRFTEINDDDGFPCEDIERLEEWIRDNVNILAKSEKYDLTAINFATYGATLTFLDQSGKRIAPVYNYLKPVYEKIPERIYKKYGGQDEFCRRTASPALGMLNSGIQALWLKYRKPEYFEKVRYILHFPQYLSYLLTGKIYSEPTSLGCHTALWDFDNMNYHPWTSAEGLKLPDPVDISTTEKVNINGKTVQVGIGIHDSSSSLVPYFSGSKGKFILLSTGTWCINMNPFNSEILTAEQLDLDCLCYLSISQQPVKSSRLFLGHLHKTAVNQLNNHFKTDADHYKNIKPDKSILTDCFQKRGKNRFFFDNLPYSRELKTGCDYYTFITFEEAYHQLMIELTEITVEAIDFILPVDDDIENIYITGGFADNQLFCTLISNAYPMKYVYTSEISNSTALGAAIVILQTIAPDNKPVLNLGLNRC
jgi:sugar (pentulose or hexulose) kinase